jgi:hypothetical protein
MISTRLESMLSLTPHLNPLPSVRGGGDPSGRQATRLALQLNNRNDGLQE